MSNPTRVFSVVLAALTLSSPAWAQQGCRQADIAGAWEMYIVEGEVVTGSWGGWTACRINITRQGATRGSCIDDEDARARIVGGQLRVGNNCRVAGRLMVGDSSGISIAVGVPRATLSRSGDTIVGVTRTTLGDLLFTSLLQMIRS